MVWRRVGGLVPGDACGVHRIRRPCAEYTDSRSCHETHVTRVAADLRRADGSGTKLRYRIPRHSDRQGTRAEGQEGHEGHLINAVGFFSLFFQPASIGK